MAGVRIDRVTEVAAVVAAAGLFDDSPKPGATERFLAEPGHHLLVAYDGSEPVGFVSGVELTHPDKGTEMFLYELGVAESARGRGVGRALVAALADLARERGCYGMWVLAEGGNEPALRAYEAAGGTREPDQAYVTWSFDDG